MYNTVTYTLILKLYPTPPSGGGVEGRWCRSRTERVEGVVEEGKVEKKWRVTIRQVWECKFETLVH